MRMHEDQTVTQHHFVHKGWGFEVWIHNDENYCGKILHIKAGKKFSWHYHKLKEETFYVQSGRVLLTYGWEEDIFRAKTVILGPDSSFHIPVGMIHQVLGLEDANIFEFSTTHYDSDSYRILKGD